MPEKLSTDQITDLSVPAEMLEETLKALGAGTKNIERLPNLKVQLAKKDDLDLKSEIDSTSNSNSKYFF